MKTLDLCRLYQNALRSWHKQKALHPALVIPEPDPHAFHLNSQLGHLCKNEVDRQLKEEANRK